MWHSNLIPVFKNNKNHQAYPVESVLRVQIQEETLALEGVVDI